MEMEIIRENLSLIIFSISIISLIIKQNLTIQKNQMKIIEVERDLIELKEHQEADSKTINKLYTMLEKSLSEQKLQFEFIQKTLVRLDKE